MADLGGTLRRCVAPTAGMCPSHAPRGGRRGIDDGSDGAVGNDHLAGGHLGGVKRSVNDDGGVRDEGNGPLKAHGTGARVVCRLLLCSPVEEAVRALRQPSKVRGGTRTRSGNVQHAGVCAQLWGEVLQARQPFRPRERSMGSQRRPWEPGKHRAARWSPLIACGWTTLLYGGPARHCNTLYARYVRYI